MATPAIAQQFLPFHRALIEDAEIEAVLQVLRSGWLTTGPKTKEFEAAFSRYVGASHSVAVSSCTAGLHLALAALGIEAGDEVILPTMTFSSTGEVVMYFKARPVLVDCEEDSFQMDPEEIERAITPRTKAIIVVHHSGCPANLTRIHEIARRRNIKIIEDAAHALPARYNGIMIGSLSDITCFSFYATKTLTTGEGGMVCTENAAYADRIRILSLHGISRDAYKRYTAEGSWRYEILDVGYKYNLTDMQSALGLAQLTKCDAMRETRWSIAERYSSAFAGIDALETPVAPANVQHAWHLYVLRLNLDRLSITRDTFIQELKERGIGTSVHFIPLHLHPLYQQQLFYRNGQFPNAERHFERSISLPLFPGMTEADVQRVISNVSEIATNSPA